MFPEPLKFPTARIVAGGATIACVCGETLHTPDLTDEVACDVCGRVWVLHATIQPGTRRDGDPPAGGE